MTTCKHCAQEFKPSRAEQVYCSKSCASHHKGAMRKGQKTGPQHGRQYVRRQDKDGYIRVYAGNHPFADGRLMILEHVAVMEVKIGRRLSPGEVVHHKNHQREDNRLENLEIMTRSAHCKIHGMQSVLRTRKQGGQYA